MDMRYLTVQQMLRLLREEYKVTTPTALLMRSCHIDQGNNGVQVICADYRPLAGYDNVLAYEVVSGDGSRQLERFNVRFR